MYINIYKDIIISFFKIRVKIKDLNCLFLLIGLYMKLFRSKLALICLDIEK